MIKVIILLRWDTKGISLSNNHFLFQFMDQSHLFTGISLIEFEISFWWLPQKKWWLILFFLIFVGDEYCSNHRPCKNINLTIASTLRHLWLIRRILIYWSIVFLQVNKALVLDRSKSQWVDIGIHTEACMTHPETCSAAGGAVSLWLKLIDCSHASGGIVSSRAHDSSGIRIRCTWDVIG